jgi:hypothetical protein
MTAIIFDLQIRNGLNPCGIPEQLRFTFAQQCCALLNAADLAIGLPLPRQRPAQASQAPMAEVPFQSGRHRYQIALLHITRELADAKLSRSDDLVADLESDRY